jgi:hypothetical protein
LAYTKANAELFGVKTPAISKHLKNIFNEGELKEEVVISILETTTKHGAIKGKTQKSSTQFYNLDAIISVGYRVSSSRATQFRIWATDVLKKYLTQGYALNNKMLKAQNAKIINLQQTISLLSRSIQNQIETVDDAQKVAKILDNFAKGLDLLDNFDHKTLDDKGCTQKPAVKISEKEYLNIIDKMKSEFASDVFANPKDGSFASSIIWSSLRLAAFPTSSRSSLSGRRIMIFVFVLRITAISSKAGAWSAIMKPSP